MRGLRIFSGSAREMGRYSRCVDFVWIFERINKSFVGTIVCCVERYDIMSLIIYVQYVNI